MAKKQKVISEPVISRSVNGSYEAGVPTDSLITGSLITSGRRTAHCAVTQGDTPEMALGLGRDLKRKFEDARRYARNPLVELTLHMRKFFFDFGFGMEPTKEFKAKVSVFDRWKTNHHKALSEFRRGVWREQLLQNNTIAVWRTGGTRPFILPPEKVTYMDAGGIEVLKYRHQLRPEQIAKLPTKRLQDYYTNTSEVEILEENGEFFSVLKDTALGTGLDEPSVESIFPACKQYESLQAGDNVLGLEARNLIVAHKKGYEIRAGLKAGSKESHLQISDAKAIEKGFKGKTGRLQVIENFDADHKFYYVDPKFFDPIKYSSAEARIIWWATPLLHMALSRGGVAPFLMILLRAQAKYFRELVGPWLEDVIERAFRPAGGTAVTVSWDETIFSEPRLFNDMLKFALQAGVVSPQTTREKMGFDDEEERARTAAAHEQPKAQNTPVYEPNQGGLKGKQTGRPPNAPDEGKNG